MTPEERNLLEQTYKFAEENNKLLIKIWRTHRFSLVLRILYWVVIIGVSFGAFYLIQPYIDAITGGASTTTPGDVNKVDFLKDLLN